VTATFGGRVVVVTGAARGLGRDYARFFAADGAHVVLADVGDTAPAVAEASSLGPACIGVVADVTVSTSVEAMVARTVETFGRFDVLVNNAGLWRGLSDPGLLSLPADVWRRTWDVNVDGTLACCRAVVPEMARNGWGRIVNISSMASRSASTVYGLTKNTVERLTEGLAPELGPLGITVNCVAPGISAFEAARDTIPNADAVVARTAVARVGTSRDLYAAIRYLCSEDASWVTGQTLRVDGGAW
jgi:NAD(P)-dependent dehydrogenase (short-subunit alcohol dehydrogenase family)